jgi:hypothetical protein
VLVELEAVEQVRCQVHRRGVERVGAADPDRPVEHAQPGELPVGRAEPAVELDEPTAPADHEPGVHLDLRGGEEAERPQVVQPHAGDHHGGAVAGLEHPPVGELLADAARQRGHGDTQGGRRVQLQRRELAGVHRHDESTRGLVPDQHRLQARLDAWLGGQRLPVAGHAGQVGGAGLDDRLHPAGRRARDKQPPVVEEALRMAEGVDRDQQPGRLQPHLGQSQPRHARRAEARGRHGGDLHPRVAPLDEEELDVVGLLACIGLVSK